MSRQRCTPENPMPKDAPGQWEHEGAKEEPTYSDYCQNWKCRDCGKEWTEELPE